MLVSSQPHAACHLLSRLMPRLACAEPFCKPHCLCHRSLTLLDTGKFGSHRASLALSRLLAFIACIMQAMRCMSPALYLGSRSASPALSNILTSSLVSSQPHAACHLLSRLMPRLACAEPSCKPHCLCHRSLTLLDTGKFGSHRASLELSPQHGKSGPFFAVRLRRFRQKTPISMAFV